MGNVEEPRQAVYCGLPKEKPPWGADMSAWKAYWPEASTAGALSTPASSSSSAGGTYNCQKRRDSGAHVKLTLGEVLVHDEEALFVDFEVFVVLQVVDLDL